jgi:hypothetical protein
VIRDLLYQLIPQSEAIDLVSELTNNGTNPEIVKLRQWQILVKLHEWENSREGKSSAVASLEKSVAKAWRRHLLRHLSANNPASKTHPIATSGEGVLAIRNSRDVLVKKTIQKIDSILSED